jgi:hypothetical protein
MISWGEPSVVPFEFTSSQSSSYSSTQSGSGNDFVPGNVTTSLSYVEVISGGRSYTANERFSSEYVSSFTGATLATGRTQTNQTTEFTSETFTTTFSPVTNTTQTLTVTNTSGSTITLSQDTVESSGSETAENIFTTSNSTEGSALVVTTTTSTEQEFFTITQEGTTSFVVLTSADSGDGWTNTTSSSETTSPVAAGPEFEDQASGGTREKTVTILTETGSTIANAFNTIYEAFPDEVLYVAGSVPLDGYGGVGQTAQTATRTTISGEFETISVLVAASGDPASTITNSSFSSSISWSRTSFTTSQATGATLFRLPHSTTTLTVFSFETASSGHTLSIPEAVVTHQGNTVTTQLAYNVVKTVSRFAAGFSSSAYQTTYLDSSVRTATATLGPVFLSGSNSASGATGGGGTFSSSENGGGGNSTYQKQPIYLGVRPRASSARWSVFGQYGAEANDQTGLSYTITDNISFVEQVGANRVFDGPITIKPATNGTYTADRQGITWTTISAGSATTSSAAIEVDGAVKTTLFFGAGRQGLLGGDLAANETAVQRATRGVYVDQDGNTTFFEGHETSYTGEKGTTYYKPKWWLGNGGPRVTAVPRNSAELEDFFPFEP